MDLKTLKEHLIKFKYPNIHVLSTMDEIGNVLVKENRIFFLSWVVGLIGEYNLPTEKNALQLALADILQENGCCSSSQKLKFVTDELAKSEQLSILTRIFKYVSTDIKTVSTQETFSFDDLNGFINKDLNLFPLYGPIKLVNPKERLAKINKCEDSIKNTKALIQSIKVELNNKIIIELENNSDEVDFDGLKDDLNTLENKSILLSKLPIENKSDLEFISEEPSFCRDQIKITSKSMHNMKVISNFQNNCKSIETSEENQDLLNNLCDYAKMSNELI